MCTEGTRSARSRAATAHALLSAQLTILGSITTQRQYVTFCDTSIDLRPDLECSSLFLRGSHPRYIIPERAQTCDTDSAHSLRFYSAAAPGHSVTSGKTRYFIGFLVKIATFNLSKWQSSLRSGHNQLHKALFIGVIIIFLNPCRDSWSCPKRYRVSYVLR